MAIPVTVPTAEPTAEPTAVPQPPVALSQEDLNGLREHIRMEERSKLQNRIDTLETAQTENLTLREQLLVANGQQSTSAQALVQAQQELATLQDSVTAEDSTVDVAKLIREVNDKAEERYATKTQDQLAALNTSVQEMKAENELLRVSNYRQTRINEETAKGEKFISELVNGNTEAEVETSIHTAIETYKNYFGSGPAPVGATPPTGTPPAPSPMPGASPVREPVEGQQAHATPSSPADNGEGVATMVKNLAGRQGKAVYEENREALLDAATSEFHSTVGANPMAR